MAIQTKTPLTEEDIIDFFNEFKRLQEFVEDLTCILYDNTSLPGEIKEEISTLYQKKFG